MSVGMFDELYEGGDKVVNHKKYLAKKGLTKSIRVYKENIKNKIEELEIENEVLLNSLINNTDPAMLDSKLKTLFNNEIDLGELARVLLKCEDLSTKIFGA